jgi:putative tryptophan/tyrosine transport system substrate-binding protein
MKRREFITGLGAAVWPYVASAQRPVRVRRVGLLMGIANDAEGQARAAVVQNELQKLGWVAGDNIQFDTRWAGGNADLFRSYAAELVRRQPDVLLANGGPSAMALQHETHDIPVVFVLVVDPVAQGFVESLSRPGSNMTGFSLLDGPMTAKRVELLKEMAPDINHVTLMFNPQGMTPTANDMYRAYFAAAASALKIGQTIVPVENVTDIAEMFAALARSQNSGVVIPPDTFMIANGTLISRLAARHRLPIVYSVRRVVAEGGLMSYGPDPLDQHRRAASYIDRILRSENPSELPVQQPTKFELVINIKTAKALGLAVPPSILLRADEVIE